MDNHQLFLPLLSTTTTTSTTVTTTTTTAFSGSSALDNIEDDYLNVVPSNSGIIFRLVTIFTIGIISLWANYEASKSFDITIINDIPNTPAGKRFAVLYESNDKAIRIIQITSSTIENILYPNTNFTRKKVSHVTLRLVSTNQTNLVTVTTNPNHEFVIRLSPSSIMVEPKNLEFQVRSIVVQAMARIWVWDGEPVAPTWLVDGLVEYTKRVTGFAKISGVGRRFCMGDDDPGVVADFLDHCNKVSNGFIPRLNQGLKDGWHNFTVEDALGLPAYNICHSLVNNSNEFSISS